MIKINRNFFNFHHSLGVYDPKVPTNSNQWAESVWEIRINSFLWKTCIGCYIPSYLATITNDMMFSHPPLGPWNCLPGRTNGLRGGRSIHSIQMHSWDRSRVATVLCTVGQKRQKYEKSWFHTPPPATWVETYIWENQPSGGVWGIFYCLVFVHRLTIFLSWFVFLHSHVRWVSRISTHFEIFSKALFTRSYGTNWNN